MRDYSVIAGETIVIRRTNPRTPMFIYLAVLFLIAFPVMMIVTPGMRSLPWFFLLMIGVVTALNLRVWGLLTKITIGPEGVHFKSPVKERLYLWKEIRSAGMVLKNGNRFKILDRHQFNEKYYLRLKYVWFSIHEWKRPSGFSFPSESYCDFEFQQEAWELFNKYLINNPDPNKLPGFDQFVGETRSPNHWMH